MNMQRLAVGFIFCGIFFLSLMGGGSGGCSSNAPSQAATTLEGTYDCIDGCSGECQFSDVMEIVLGRTFSEEGRTTLDVRCTIETELNEFVGSEDNGGVRDDGRFAFDISSSDGDIECAGSSDESGVLTVGCIAVEIVGEESIERNCQEVIYQKNE